jgi:hypothetical protein
MIPLNHLAWTQLRREARKKKRLTESRCFVVNPQGFTVYFSAGVSADAVTRRAPSKRRCQ